MGAKYSSFKALSYISQVVAGTNYKVKISVDGGKTIESTIFKPLPNKGQNPELKDCK